MPTVAQHWQLGKTQAELDFVNVEIDADIPLFVDPFAISLKEDAWSIDCTHRIQYYFQQVVDRIRAGDRTGARKLLENLREPNETRLGLSSGRPRGAGIGSLQADQLLEALEGSAAVTTGFLRYLEEAELMIEGVGRDKISDLTTNIIRSALAGYTLEQCLLLGIPTQQVALPPCFDIDENRWVSRYFDLPVAGRGPILLVPKASVRYDFSYDHQEYYRDFVVDFLRAEELHAGSGLVHVLKNGKRKVYKKDVQAKYPLSKDFLYEFSRNHPDVLEQYRESLESLQNSIDTEVVGEDEQAIAVMLIAALQATPPGDGTAAQYHNLMIGVVEFLFFPHLQHPRKEERIHQGRKRIDIVMENGARTGATLHNLHEVKKLPCAYVPIECKNYRTDVANPDIDQLAGRFSFQRGQFGMLACRAFEDRATFIERCRDTHRDGRGLIVPIDDNTVTAMLTHVAEGNRSQIDILLNDLIREVWVA